MSNHWDAEVLREQLAAAKHELARMTDLWEAERARADHVTAELEFARRWCAANFTVMPPSREQNEQFMRALDQLDD